MKWKWVSGILAILVVAAILIGLYVVQRPPNIVGPTWNGITIGGSMPEDVVRILGQPDHQTPSITFGRTFYFYPDFEQKDKTPWLTVVFKQRKVVEIRQDLLLAPETYRKENLADFITLYGNPNYVTWASSMHRFSRVVVFPDEGILILAEPVTTDPTKALVVAAVYSFPCSLDCIKSNNSLFFGSGPPNPEFSPLPSEQLLEDPWGLTKK